MKTLFHGTSKLFYEFCPLKTIGTGEGKSKFGWGVYLTSAFATAVLYSGKGPGRDAKDHYVYSVEIPDPEQEPDKYFTLFKPVPEHIINRVEKEVGPIPDKEAVCAWGLDFRKALEEMLYSKQYGYAPKGKEEGGIAQKMAADWFYSHGIIGLIWPQSSWPARGEDKIVEKLNIAMFNGDDIKIAKIERVEVEFKVKNKKQPEKKTCMEKEGSVRQIVYPAN